MGCGWSLQGRPSGYWFPMSAEEEKQLDEVSTALKKIDDNLLILRLRHDNLYKRIREPGLSRKMQLLIFAHTKKNHGLQLVLANMRLSIEESMIMADVVQVLRYSRNTLIKLARKSKDINIYEVIDEVKQLTDDMDEAQNSLMDLSDVDEAELEQELQQYLEEDKSIPKPSTLSLLSLHPPPPPPQTFSSSSSSLLEPAS